MQCNTSVQVAQIAQPYNGCCSMSQPVSGLAGWRGEALCHTLPAGSGVLTASYNAVSGQSPVSICNTSGQISICIIINNNLKTKIKIWLKYLLVYSALNALYSQLLYKQVMLCLFAFKFTSRKLHVY